MAVQEGWVGKGGPNGGRKSGVSGAVFGPPREVFFQGFGLLPGGSTFSCILSVSLFRDRDRDRDGDRDGDRDMMRIEVAIAIAMVVRLMLFRPLSKTSYIYIYIYTLYGHIVYIIQPYNIYSMPTYIYIYIYIVINQWFAMNNHGKSSLITINHG